MEAATSHLDDALAALTRLVESALAALTRLVESTLAALTRLVESTLAALTPRRLVESALAALTRLVETARSKLVGLDVAAHNAGHLSLPRHAPAGLPFHLYLASSLLQARQLTAGEM